MHYRQPFSGEYPITQRFGETVTDPKGHTGIDYACPVGTPILASADGTVIYAGWKDDGYGYCVFLRHADGNLTIYEHLTAPVPVKVGMKVGQSDVIGYSGSTGNSTGPHLHFEARDANNQPFDPVKLPLMSMDETAVSAQPPAASALKEPDHLGNAVRIVCPLGAWGWSADFGKRQTVFPEGTELTFTGRTTKRNEYTYCEVYPEPVKYWVAVHDGTTQILDDLA